MTIDEVIEYYNKEAEYCENRIVEWNEKFSNRCKVEVEQYRQIAEWLEELKVFKELYPDADVKGSLVTNYNNGWNDAIDKIDKLLLDRFTCNDLRTYWATDIRETIHFELEQLKEK